MRRGLPGRTVEARRNVAARGSGVNLRIALEREARQAASVAGVPGKIGGANDEAERVEIGQRNDSGRATRSARRIAALRCGAVRGTLGWY